MDSRAVSPDCNNSCFLVVNEQVPNVQQITATKSAREINPQSASFQQYTVKQIKLNTNARIGQWIHDSLNQNIESLKAILATGFDINAKNALGATALHLAVQENHIKIVEFLLENKANVNATLPTFKTPLYLAAERGFIQIVQVLLKYGANPNTQTLDGFTPLQIATKKEHQAIVELLSNKSE